MCLLSLWGAVCRDCNAVAFRYFKALSEATPLKKGLIYRQSDQTVGRQN